jgi:hypothetical protein
VAKDSNSRVKMFFMCLFIRDFSNTVPKVISFLKSAKF